METEQILQNSPEWHADRLGWFTASNAKLIAGGTRNKEKMRGSYLDEVLGNAWAGDPRDFSSKATDWGHAWEPAARERYRLMHPALIVREIDRMELPLLHASCSPDGLVYEKGGPVVSGMIQIKCPETPKEHVRTMREGIKDDYLWQMQMEMLISGAGWNDYVSFHPRFPTDLQFWVKRVERDGRMITIIQEGLLWLNAERERLTGLWMPLPG